MNFSKISVIIPIYNAGGRLRRCVMSVLAQSYQNIEVILVNDGSVDDSCEVCQRLSTIDSRVIVINKTKNEGAAEARNCGLQTATGEYVMFVDADDFLDRDMCYKLADCMSRHCADVVICGYNRVDGENVSCKSPGNMVVGCLEEFCNVFPVLYDGAMFNAIWNKLYRLDKICKSFCQKPRVGEDLLFNLSYFLNCNKIVCIDECLYNYDVSVCGGLMSQYDERLLDDEIMMHTKVRDFFERVLGGKDFKIINRVFAKELYYYLKKLVILGDGGHKDKLQKIMNCAQDPHVCDMLRDVDHNDPQVRLICLLLKRKMVNLIYVFFKIKTLANQKGIH